MKVFPTSDNIRKILSHPTGGPFRAEGPAEWPDDVYTHRRIADGDVTTEEKKPQPQPQPHHETKAEEKPPSAEPPKQEPAPTQKPKEK